MSGLLLPFGGFLMLGFAGASLRTLISKFWPKYLDKKQPKPISKKDKKNLAKKQNLQSFAEVPDFDADESLFSIEDISQDDETETQDYGNSSSTEYNPTVIIEQQPTRATNEAPKTVAKPAAEPVIAPVKEKSEAPAPQPIKPPVPSKPQPPVIRSAVKKPHSGLKELSLDDISADTSKPSRNTPLSGANADDELELLMNRSIGDILSEQKKEDNK